MPETKTTTLGLTSAEAKARLLRFGPNEIISETKLSSLWGFLVKFKNPLVFILLFAAIISAFFGELASALIIILIVILSVALDFFNTYKSHKAAEALKAKVMITARTLRSGQWVELPLAEIVPGDVVEVTAGDVVPADGRILSARDFFLNESSLTGESFPVEKDVSAAVSLGTNVVTGHGQIQVQQTGRNTKFSKIAQDLGRKPLTEFDRGIKDFSYLIMKVTFVLVILIFLINALFKRDILESFLFSAALAVGLTPELLPMIITLNLSKGSLRMSKHGVIVKQLSAIQNCGGMDVLCTDKTGTLTEDKIVLVKYVDARGQEAPAVLKHAYLSSAFRSGFSNPLDNAVKNFKTLDVSGYEKVDEIPFDYTRRRDSVILRAGRKRLLISKGAPEELLQICRYYGSTQEKLTPRLRRLLHTQYQELSKDGFRVLAVSYKPLTGAKKTLYTKEDETDLVMQGYMAFLDPPKKTVMETLKILEHYGIKIKIITGDNELVTEKIAREINLPIQGILLGQEIEKFSDRKLRLEAEKTSIFARVSPEQKKRIIQALQKNGHVVGYLGDGINDAPGLQAADVSISVNNAVDVAKQSADLILLRKSLHELVSGVIEGRKTFANTLKYLMMTLSSNFGNMFSMAGASIFLPFLPMLPTQILFNNLLYDSSQFTIPLDNVAEEEIKIPRRLNIPAIKKFMLLFGPVSSIFDFLTFFVLLAAFHATARAFQTGWFLESLTTQTLVIYIIRTRFATGGKNPPNKYLVLSTAAAVIIGWIVGLSALGRIMGFTPLPLPVLFSLVLITAGYLVSVELLKRRFYKSISM